MASKPLVGMSLRMSFSQNRTFELWKNFMPRRKEITDAVNGELVSMQVYPDEFDFKNFDTKLPSKNGPLSQPPMTIQFPKAWPRLPFLPDCMRYSCTKARPAKARKLSDTFLGRGFRSRIMSWIIGHISKSWVKSTKMTARIRKRKFGSLSRISPEMLPVDGEYVFYGRPQIGHFRRFFHQVIGTRFEVFPNG